jgi:UDP-N-acetylglucosamine transferase subunit ALG13
MGYHFLLHVADDGVGRFAGAGSITEALGMKKNLFVVVNESLMDNHQVSCRTLLPR